MKRSAILDGAASILIQKLTANDVTIVGSDLCGIKVGGLKYCSSDVNSSPPSFEL